MITLPDTDPSSLINLDKLIDEMNDRDGYSESELMRIYSQSDEIEDIFNIKYIFNHEFVGNSFISKFTLNNGSHASKPFSPALKDDTITVATYIKNYFPRAKRTINPLGNANT